MHMHLPVDLALAMRLWCNIWSFQYTCRKAYAPLVEAGYVEVVYGATKEGSFLCNHDLIKSIHLTGSTATYDAVVWGGKKKVLIWPL